MITVMIMYMKKKNNDIVINKDLNVLNFIPLDHLLGWPTFPFLL